MTTLRERGFTMPELLVAVTIILLLTAGSFWLLRPKVHTAEDLRSERRLEIAALAQALKRYQADMNGLPADLPTKATVIGVGDDAYDLCSTLVPKYVKDIPLDPQVGIKYQDSEQLAQSGPACSELGVEYISGYTIAKTASGVTLAAPTTGKDAVAVTVR